MPRIPPPIVALVTALLIWALAHWLPLARFQFPMQALLALGLAMIGGALDVTAALHFRSAKTTINPIAIQKASSLVTGGPFAFSRNPMYLGLALILSGLAIYEAGLASFIMIPLFMLYITTFQIKPEEQMMRNKFGADYAAYCARVRRWI